MIVALLTALALSQGLTTNAPGVTGGGKVLASYPLTTSGPLITEDANTVAHVYWNGTALVDTKGNAWTMNGTVPQVTANPFTTTRYGGGPFSDANYYSLGTGTDVLDFAGDFTVCAVFVPNSAGGTVVSNGTYGATGAGWRIYVAPTTGIAYFQTFGPSSTGTNSLSVLGASASAAGVVCGGVAGTSQYLKLNGATTIVTASAVKAPATSVPAIVGYVAGLANAFDGTIYEVYATTTPFTEATVTAIQQKVLGHYDGTAPLAVTRATNATYENPAGTIWTVPPGVARITTDGLLVEPARTNYALASATHPKAAEPSGSLPIATQYVAWSDTTLSVVAGGATVTGLSCSNVAAGTLCPFAVTAAGTVVITTAAGGTHVQIENGPYRTSRIVTTTTAVARNADAISATVPAVPANHAIRVGAVAYADQTTSTGTRVWSLGTSGANTASLDIKSIYTVTDAASGVKAHTTTAVPSYASHTLTTLNKGGTLSLNLPGSTAGAGTGLLATPPTTLYFGSASGTSLHLGGTIKGLKIYKATKIGDAK